MNKILLLILLLIGGLSAGQAQVRVTKPIELTGDQDQQRQVHGVPTVVAPDAVLNAEMELTGTHRYAEPTAGSVWQVDLPALTQPPVAGTQILVRAPAPVPGELQMMINGYGPFAITLGADGPLMSDHVPEGTVLSLVFDGTDLQLINGIGHALRPCPEGMEAVNAQYCIQAMPYPETTTFWDAIEICGGQGQRLCSWSEYYAACANAVDLGITMPNAWEWTNQTANEDNSVRIVGVPGCTAATTADPITLRNHRCCFSR